MWLTLISTSLGGLGPPDVLVLSNGEDSDSVALAEAYAEARQLPAGHHCPITGVDGSAEELTLEQAQELRTQLDACLQALPDPDEIDALVTVRGLPVRVGISGGSVSLQAFLQVHDVEIGGAPVQGQAGSANGVASPTYIFDRWSGEQYVDHEQMAYYVSALGIAAGTWPQPFERRSAGSYPGADFNGQLFAVGRLDGFDYSDGHDLIQRSVDSDSSLPAQPMLCMEGLGPRAPRDPECEVVVGLLEQVQGSAASAEWLAPHDAALTGREVSAVLTGTADLKAMDLDYAPGAFVGNLTSYGAVPQNFVCSEDGATCPANESQTSIARFIRDGASAAHGTVAEPYNHCFPNAGLLLMLAAGYSYGEAILANQRYLYWKNLYLGDPLMAPWGERPTVELPTELSEGGLARFTAQHPDGVSELRLFVDGLRVAEGAGDTLDWEVTGLEGEQLELMVVAVSGGPDWGGSGWPADPAPTPGVQGWSVARFELGPPVEVDSGDTGLDAPPPGCGGCSGGGSAGWLGVLVALGMLGRRRGANGGECTPSGRQPG